MAERAGEKQLSEVARDDERVKCPFLTFLT